MSFNKWNQFKFSDFVSINPTISLKGGNTYSFIEMKDLSEGKRYVQPSADKKITGGARFREGNTLFARITPCLENGKIGQAKNLKDGVGFGSTEFLVFEEKESVSNKDFIYYLACWQEVRKFAEQNMIGTSGRQRVGKDAFEKLELKFPDLKSQQKIASILSSLDDKIELNNKTNQTLEAMVESFFKHRFIQEADESWEKINFGELVKPKRGKNITKAQAIEGEYPVVAGGLEPSCYHQESNTTAPVVTISSSGANAGFVRLYHNAVWAADCSYIDKTITSNVFFSYVFLKLNQKILYDKQVGSAQPHIYPSHIMEMSILNYPKKLIEKFEKEVEPLFLQIKENEQENITLTSIRQTLLPKLMAGEIKI